MRHLRGISFDLAQLFSYFYLLRVYFTSLPVQDPCAQPLKLWQRLPGTWQVHPQSQIYNPETHTCNDHTVSTAAQHDDKADGRWYGV